MPRFRATVKLQKTLMEFILRQGMSVEVGMTSSSSNPLTMNGGEIAFDAFMRIYGIDVKKTGILSTVYLDVR